MEPIRLQLSVRAFAALVVMSGCGTPLGRTSNSASDASRSSDGIATIDADQRDAAPSLDSIASKAPVTLASGQSTPNCLAVDANNVYWTTSDGKVMSVPISGGEPTVLASDQPAPFGIAADDANVFWVNSSDSSGAVMTVPVAGGARRVLADNQRGPVRIAVADGFVYWTNRTSGTVMRMPASGGTPTTLATRQGALTAVVVAADDVYWSAIGQDAIRWLPEGGAVSTLITGVHAVALFAVGTSLYWADARLSDAGAEIFRLDARRGEIFDLGHSPSPVAAVADQQHVYWPDDATGTIRRAPVEGGDAVVVATGQVSPSELAIDAANVYWINATTSGSVMKLAK